jgi:hypothetical protein
MLTLQMFPFRLNLEKASLHDSKEGGIDKSSAQNLEAGFSAFIFIWCTAARIIFPCY